MTDATFADRDGWIWLDGEMVPWRDAKIHVLTHTLHYGVGVFEGVRAYKTDHGTCIFRLQEHTKRLFNSAHILQMNIPYDMETLMEAQCEVVRANGLDEAYLRPLAFLGSEGMGLNVAGISTHVCIATWPWPAYMAPETVARGIKMLTSSYTRHHVNITMCKAKATGNYINSILALSEAVAAGADEALMLDNEGYVAEGTGENIFVVRDGVLHTPELTSCLDGITRNSVFQLAKDLGIEIRERRMTRDELYIADEIFLTGSAAEILPVREIDGRKIGGGERPMADLFRKEYLDHVRGKRNTHADWLYPVSGADSEASTS